MSVSLRPDFTNPPSGCGDPSGGNSAAPPRPSPQAGAAFSLPRERGSYRRRDACVLPAGLPDTREESRALIFPPPDFSKDEKILACIEVLSVVIGFAVAEAALIFFILGHVQ
jgi:hypothetical protein